MLLYQRIVDKFIYLSHTRSNISYVFSVINQLIHNHREVNLHNITLQYQKVTLSKGIIFK